MSETNPLQIKAPPPETPDETYRQALKISKEATQRNPHARDIAATIDIVDWAFVVNALNIPMVPLQATSVKVPIYPLLAEGSGSIPSGEAGMELELLMAEYRRAQRAAAALEKQIMPDLKTGRLMWRWSFCAPAQLKEHMDTPRPEALFNVPMREPLGPAGGLLRADSDLRLLNILEDMFFRFGEQYVEIFTRPWVRAVQDKGYPVEFRVFVPPEGQGEITISNYYPQRDLDPKYLKYEKELRKYGQKLRQALPVHVGFSADFILEQSGPRAVTTDRLLFLEGGPWLHSHPCCLNHTLPWDGRFALAPEPGSAAEAHNRETAEENAAEDARHLAQEIVCQAGRDGDCWWAACPQKRDGEPYKTGRSCPLIPPDTNE